MKTAFNLRSCLALAITLLGWICTPARGNDYLALDEQEFKKQQAQWREINIKKLVLERDNAKLKEENTKLPPLQKKAAEVKAELKNLQELLKAFPSEPTLRWTDKTGESVFGTYEKDDGVAIVIKINEEKKVSIKRSELAPEYLKFLDHLRSRPTAAPADETSDAVSNAL